jgi:myo-inositol 2-dehydrogenase/D-chiro-inositol 1-dehydrogenase
MLRLVVAGFEQAASFVNTSSSEKGMGSMASIKRLGVGVVGLGRMGCFHAETLALRVPSAELVRIVDANESVARAVSEQMGGVDWSASYNNLLEDPQVQAVVIVTPTPFHADMVEAAAIAGKHVFCEKPVSLDPSRTYKATEATQAAGVKMQVGFHRRFDPDYRVAQRRVAAGDVGRIYLFRTSSRDPQPPRFDFLKHSGGLFADFSLHDFDLARWLVGEVEEVTAVGAALSDPEFEKLGDLDNAVIILRFVGGALGVLDNSRVSGYGYECSSEIMGSLATLRIGSQKQVGPEVLTAGSLRRGFLSRDVERWSTAYAEEMKGFVEAVLGDREPDVGGADDAAAAAIARAADRSYRQGTTVRVVDGILPGGTFLN